MVMNKRLLLNLFLSLTALWVQLVAPIAAANARPQSDPLAVICSHSDPQSQDHSNPLHQMADHGCCTLCHVQVADLPQGDRAAILAFSAANLTLLKWRIEAAAPRAGPDLDQRPPRGPPSLV